MAVLGNKFLEAFDHATSAHPRVDLITMSAKAIAPRLEIEPAVIIERRTILIELGTNASVIEVNKIDPIGT